MHWATPEDRRLAERDATLYGTVYAKRNKFGLLERIDPLTIVVHERAKHWMHPMFDPARDGDLPNFIRKLKQGG